MWAYFRGTIKESGNTVQTWLEIVKAVMAVRASQRGKENLRTPTVWRIKEAGAGRLGTEFVKPGGQELFITSNRSGIGSPLLVWRGSALAQAALRLPDLPG